jgi:hypothetical protein
MKNWQIQIGFWGGVIWMLLMFNLEHLSTMDEAITKSVTGYIMGFITVFSGHLFWEIVHGRYKRIFGEEKAIFRIISTVPLFLMAGFGLFGLVNGIFNSMPWQYNFSFVSSGIVVNQGVIPVINYIDDYC